MGCLKLTYNQEGEGLENCSVFLGGHLEKKVQSEKKRYDYMPFGLTFNSYSVAPENLYNYNGKEEQIEWSVIDYGWRMYDAAIGRWNAIDPMAEVSYTSSVYSYVNNQPHQKIDPNGMYSFDSSGGQAICPSCPDDPKYDPYRDDPNRFFEYDPNSGKVNQLMMLQEVVVEGTDESDDGSDYSVSWLRQADNWIYSFEGDGIMIHAPGISGDGNHRQGNATHSIDITGITITFSKGLPFSYQSLRKAFIAFLQATGHYSKMADELGVYDGMLVDRRIQIMANKYQEWSGYDSAPKYPNSGNTGLSPLKGSDSTLLLYRQNIRGSEQKIDTFLLPGWQERIRNNK